MGVPSAGRSVQELLELSAISLSEIAIKAARGKLNFPPMTRTARLRTWTFAYWRTQRTMHPFFSIYRPCTRTPSTVKSSAQASEMKALHELQVWIAENLHNNLSVQKLADRTAMSVRNFERVFTRELGKTPSHYVLQARAEAVRRQLETTDQGLKQIAAACGFGSTDSMRRAFLRSVGTTPRKYRRQLHDPERFS